MRCLRIVLTIVLVLVCSQAVAEKRVALVIGNSAYQHASRLPNPENDAPDMAAKLEGLGFEVVLGSNLDLAGVRYAIGIFVEKLADADMALFYYAGHGLQVNGENYIAPVDAKLLSYLDLEFETVPISLVLSAMERRPGINLVILDACRDNPLAANLVRSMGTRSSSVGRGLAKIGGGLNSLIAFATQPGNVAFDGAGRNSPFTAALLRHLGTPGQDITRELIDVRRDVVIETSGRQVPWDSSSLTREVVLKPMAKPEPPAAAAPQHNAAELAFWDAIKASNQKDVFDATCSNIPTAPSPGWRRRRSASSSGRRPNGPPPRRRRPRTPWRSRPRRQAPDRRPQNSRSRRWRRPPPTASARMRRHPTARWCAPSRRS
jgi:uncharacterized caspase-like protein